MRDERHGNPDRSSTAARARPLRLSGEARVLVGRRIEGRVFVYDYPRDGRGRRYFVESGFESKAELAVLLADYRRRAERLGTCPMSREAIERAFALPCAEPIPAQDRTP